MIKNYFGATDVGRMRQNNEDAFFVQPVLGGAFLAACVIDGVGGYEGGEVAAQIAQQVLPDYLRIPSGDVPTMMQEAMITANEKILAHKVSNPALADMACVATLVLTAETENVFHFIHVGDTRLYLFRDGSLVKVSKDQSFVGFLEDAGRISEREAMNHPKRNEINKALGFEPQIRRDYFDAGSSPFLPGDLLLLCSDGLTDLVPAEAIKAVLQSDGTLQQKTEELIRAANEGGGKDNITVVLVQHSRQPKKQRALKPKKKAAPKAATRPQKAAAAPQIKLKEEPPVISAPKKEVPKKNMLVWVLGGLCLLLAAALVWVLAGQKNKVSPIGVPSAEMAQLVQLLQSAGNDTLKVPLSLAAQTVVQTDSLRVQQDTVLLDGQGLHLKADEAYDGAGFLLAQTNRYLLLQNMVLEDFNVGVLVKNQTVRLRDVQFLNCIVPVQYGYAAPVNSPPELIIKDTLFTQQDTLAH